MVVYWNVGTFIDPDDPFPLDLQVAVGKEFQWLISLNKQMDLLALSKIAIQHKEVDTQYSSLNLKKSQLFAGVFKSCFKSRIPFFQICRKQCNFFEVRYVKPQI